MRPVSAMGPPNGTPAGLATVEEMRVKENMLHARQLRVADVIDAAVAPGTRLLMRKLWHSYYPQLPMESATPLQQFEFLQQFMQYAATGEAREASLRLSAETRKEVVLYSQRGPVTPYQRLITLPNVNVEVDVDPQTRLPHKPIDRTVIMAVYPMARCARHMAAVPGSGTVVPVDDWTGREVWTDKDGDLVCVIFPTKGIQYIEGMYFGEANLDDLLPILRRQGPQEPHVLAFPFSSSSVCVRYMPKMTKLGVIAATNTSNLNWSMGTSTDVAALGGSLRTSEHCVGPAFEAPLYLAVKDVEMYSPAWLRWAEAQRGRGWEFQCPLVLPAPLEAALSAVLPMAEPAALPALLAQLPPGTQTAARRAAAAVAAYARAEFAHALTSVADVATAAGEGGGSAGGSSSSSSSGGIGATAWGPMPAWLATTTAGTPMSVQVLQREQGALLEDDGTLEIAHGGGLFQNAGHLCDPKMMVQLGQNPLSSDYSFPGLTPEGRSRGGRADYAEGEVKPDGTQSKGTRKGRADGGHTLAGGNVRTPDYNFPQLAILLDEFFDAAFNGGKGRFKWTKAATSGKADDIQRAIGFVMGESPASAMLRFATAGNSVSKGWAAPPTERLKLMIRAARTARQQQQEQEGERGSA